jgi:hypothetical protein
MPIPSPTVAPAINTAIAISPAALLVLLAEQERRLRRATCVTSGMCCALVGWVVLSLTESCERD